VRGTGEAHPLMNSAVHEIGGEILPDHRACGVPLACKSVSEGKVLADARCSLRLPGSLLENGHGLGWLASERQSREFQKDYVAFTDCLRKFALEQQKLAEPHIKASNDAINDYNADLALALTRPAGNVVELFINKGKYFNTILDDVMEVQSDLNNLNIWADDAAEQMKIKIDTDVLAGILGAADSHNRGATAGVISGNINLGVTSTGPLSVVARSPASGDVEVLDVLLRMGQALDEQNIPETGRWVVLPTWMATLIKQSELREAYLSGDGTSMLRNGRIGMVDRFTLYTSSYREFPR